LVSKIEQRLKNDSMVKILKRDGVSVVEYNPNKIINVIKKAMLEDSQLGYNEEIAAKIEQEIYDELLYQNELSSSMMTVENVQDLVEDGLLRYDRKKTAKDYIKYRGKRDEERTKKWEMTDLQYDIWSQKYEYKNEGFEGFLERVSGGNQDVKKLIRQKKFLFGGRILANRGLNKEGIKVSLSNCYVNRSPEDNLESIFKVASQLARTYSYGGGAGIDIGKLRPHDAKVNNASLKTSGATSFMNFYSVVTETISQKQRGGALMISIPCTHPDLVRFIKIKEDTSVITKANVSVMFTDEFLQSAVDDKDFELSFHVEATGEVINKIINAREVFTMFARANWDNAEPGILLKNRIDEWNLMSEDGNFIIVTTNPCGEIPLIEFGACLLGSINLSEFVLNKFKENAEFNTPKFIEAVTIAVIALNEVLDEGIPLHPLKEQQDTARDWRQMGLGIFGLHDMFIKMGIEYGSPEAIRLSSEISNIMINSALMASSNLAKEQGTFPKYNGDAVVKSKFLIENATKETFENVSKYGLRNAQLVCVAPTGSLSTMFGVSGGIEPIYQVSYTRKTETLNDGEASFYKVFTPIAKEYMILKNIKSESDLPADIFVTAMTLDYKARIKMQSAWQQNIDSSISSTVNVPKEFTVEDTFDLYMMAWRYGLKGVTIFRDGCKRAGILGNHTEVDSDVSNMSASQLQSMLNKQIVKELLEYPNKCPKCGGELIMAGGCSECVDCGYSPCSV